jgi:membrane-associated phospholipid phosphatase
MSRRGIAIYAFFILLFGVFCYFANRFDYFPGDPGISSWIQRIDFAGAKPTMQFAPYAVGLAVLVGLRLWLPSRRRAVVFIIITALAAGAIGWFLKELISRPRPDVELVQLWEGTIFSGFPSGHVACAAAIGGFIFYLAPRLVKTPAARWFLRALLVVIILSIGVSRIYLGAHWASDVVGGLFLSGLLLYPAIVLYNKYDAKRGRRNAGAA